MHYKVEAKAHFIRWNPPPKQQYRIKEVKTKITGGHGDQLTHFSFHKM